MTTTGYTGNKALRDRVLANSFEQNVALWARVQRVRCRENAPHPRRLWQEAKRGGGEALILDLGPCAHCPDGA